MKKKLLFIIPEYSIGGTNTSLKNLLSFMNKDRYDVSVYCLYEDGGQYFKEVFESYILPKSYLYYWLHDNVFTRKFMGLAMKLSSKVSFDWLYKREAKWLQDKYSFGVVIGFQEGTATEFASYIKGVHNVAWFHCPYVNINDDNRNEYLNLYSKFDYTFCVSNTFVNMFTKALPELKDKVHCIYNTLNDEKIRRMSEVPIDDERFDENIFSIVTIGRFAKQKQFHLIPRIVDKINEIGVESPFKWYLIASGDTCKEETEQEIMKYGLQNQVIILGAKSNPYPILKASNLYVCTSDSESFSYTIAESKILHTPLVSNDFSVAYEVVDDSVGWICNIEDMARKIADIIDDKGGMYSAVRESIKKYNYDNEKILEEFYKLLN